MGATYSVILCDIYGRYVAQLAPRKMSLSQVANGVGELKLELPGWFDPHMVGPYQFVDVWRRPYGGPRQLWRYVTLAHPMAQGERGTTFYSLQASSLNVILDFRTRDNPKTDETLPVDTLLTSWAARCLSCEDPYSGFTGTSLAWRDLTRWFGWSVVQSSGVGPTVLAKGGSGSLLQFAQDVVKLGAQAGEPWFFDIIPTGSDAAFGLRFSLYRGQRGVDLTGLDPQRVGGTTLTLSREAGDLSKLEYNVDYSGEVNFVWRLSDTPPAGLRDARARSGYLRYPLARREKYGGPDADLDAMLREGQPQRVARAEVADTARHRFGVQWGWGDKMWVRLENTGRASHDVTTLVMRADSVTIDVDDAGRETVRAALNLVV